MGEFESVGRRVGISKFRPKIRLYEKNCTNAMTKRLRRGRNETIK